MGRHLYVGRKGQQKEVGKRSKNSKGEECVELEEASLPNLGVEVRRRIKGKSKVKVSCKGSLAWYGIECAPTNFKEPPEKEGVSDAESVE